ncbi:prepilin peptidase [Salmonella enterica]
MGSFMNVVIYRLPLMLYGVPQVSKSFSLAWPPSHCPVCLSRIKFYDNIPVISWLMLRGKCRCCRVGIPFVYPLTETVTGLWFVAVYLCLAEPANPSSLTFSAATLLSPPLTLFCLLYCITVIDFRHYLIPDVLSLGLLWAGMVFSVSGLLSVLPFQAVAGCVLAWGLTRGVQWGYRAVRGYEGLGAGDAKLFAAAAVWVGVSQVAWLILFSAVAGGVLYGTQWFYQRHILVPSGQPKSGAEREAEDVDPDICRHKFYIPFGPAIALATLVLYLTRI